MKLTELFNERSLTKSEEDKKEDIVKGMKKNKGDFEKRYGKEAKAVMYATATKMAKNEDVNEVLSSKGRENLRRLIHDFERQAEDMNLSDEAMDAVAMGLDQIMSDVQEIEGVRENKTPGDSHYHKEKAKELAKKDGKDPERLSYGELMDYIKKAQQMDSSHNQESVGEDAIPYNFTKQDFFDNEDENMHTENAVELAKKFGTPEEQERMEKIMTAHNTRGHILSDEQEERDELVRKYYPKLEGKERNCGCGQTPCKTYGRQNEGIVEGKALTEAEVDEAAGKKDACYHKVKARYKVWPSAYASGAVVQCRKKGATNWGNSKKK